MFAPFLIEQLEGVMESGFTVSSSFGPSPNVRMAQLRKKVEIILSLLIVDGYVHAVFKISLAKLINIYIYNCECINVRKPRQLWAGAIHGENFRQID